MSKYWYRVDIVDAKENRVLIGTSDFDPLRLTKALEGSEYLVLNDLSYRDNQNKVVSWSAWDPRLASIAYINPKHVIVVMPFVGDPRKT